MQLELFGVRVNDSGDGPFHGASVHIVVVRRCAGRSRRVCLLGKNRQSKADC